MLDRVGTDHTSSNTILKIIRRQWIYNFLFNKAYSNHQASKVITAFNIDQKKDVCYTIYYLGIQGSFHDTLPNDNHELPMYQLHITRHYHVVHFNLVLPSWFTRPLANQGGMWHSYKMTGQYYFSCSFTQFNLLDLLVMFCIIGGGCFNDILCVFILLQVLLHGCLLVTLRS
jgi:hypothetical protein